MFFLGRLYVDGWFFAPFWRPPKFYILDVRGRSTILLASEILQKVVCRPEELLLDEMLLSLVCCIILYNKFYENIIKI